jgi:hypothetical protein
VKRAKRAPNPARQSGFGPSEIGSTLREMGQTPTGTSRKLLLKVIWNEYEVERDKIVEKIRTEIEFGTAFDNHSFTFDYEPSASKFESMVEQLTKNMASVHHIP